MTHSALLAIEQIYDMPLNPQEDYYAQLEPLAANGELANHNSSLKVLFKLAMIIDEQAKKIDRLERRNVENLQPTQPLIDEPSTNQTEPNPNTTV